MSQRKRRRPRRQGAARRRNKRRQGKRQDLVLKAAGAVLVLGGTLFIVHTVPLWVWYAALGLVLAAMVYILFCT